MDDQAQPAQKSSNAKWLVACGGCCLLMFVGAVVGGYVVQQRAKGFLLGMAADGTETLAQEMFKGLALPQPEIDAAMKPVKSFTDQVRNEQVSIEQGLAVGKAITEGAVPAVVMVRGFQVKHLKPSGLSEEEKEAGYVTATRFAHGVIEDLIPEGERNAVKDLLTETKTTTGPNGQTRTRVEFKEQLTDEELREVLALMKSSADAAGLEDRAYEVDLPAEIQKAIDYGMANPIKPQ